MFQKHTKKKILFLSTKGDNRLNKPKNCDIISNCKAGDSMLEEEREYKIVGYHGTTSSAQESSPLMNSDDPVRIFSINRP